MHTPQRLVVFAVILVALVPLSTFALMDKDARNEAAQALDEAIDRAASYYRSRPRSDSGTQDVAPLQSELQALAREKREVRLKISSHRALLDELKEKYGIDAREQNQRDSLFVREPADFLSLLLERSGRSAESTSSGLRGMLVAAFEHLIGANMRSRVLRQSNTSLLTLLAGAGESVEALDSLEERHSSMQQEYAQLQRTINYAQQGIRIGGGRMDEVRRVFEEVHSQVLRMQSELARIDARLRRRAERKLIEKGLMAPKPGEHAGGIIPFTPQFAWPAYGQISAGFMDPDYQKFFGIPHRGMDIVISQGSLVVSSTDGVVFLARDGGPHGYSYVLIGHRGGYATLYGHLTHISVHAGQDVSAGEVIGASGGRPGTHGAGPTTTGPHLHFEVIKSGVNVDPRSVLP